MSAENLRNEPESKSNYQSVSLSTAGMRALIFQLQSIYLRAPLKLFRPSRFDYMIYVREQANKHTEIFSKPYKFRTHSSLGMLISVMRREGWRFIPDNVLPPLLANSATGVILYGTYLGALDMFSSHSGPKTDFAYSPVDTWRAGFLAGAMQSLAAAPIDAIYSRLTTAEMLSGKHENLWKYGAHKLKEIGLVGVFAGYAFSIVKESFGFAFYFLTFELIKTRGYNLTYRVISTYRNFKVTLRDKLSFLSSLEPKVNSAQIKKEQSRLTKILKSSFVLLAGASAAFSLLAVQYPLTKVQKIHYNRLEALDIYSSSVHPLKKRPFVKVYWNSYLDTFQQVMKNKQTSRMSWFQLAYKGFARNALTTIPATSVGLLIFEIMRTRLADDFEEAGPLE
ncbi:mitochondrial carrier protein [Metschnikowia bicuspidata var. bicuspidata NRRL YB-4993]|uniref:Mitochondrial carrier protein n=1 Tax=Metschnikowia bicuspidata var. bicuspidata NRRL YB-4993 TaxID=869754 RepID=A0A1A0HIV4_9ASCO|nr:mitochondrial carrier protein [Metschnikowia bicuspidata var. bicuspidata NRRL YB-4993]OBA24089.1 mitochondrial carrier protein [Metschnikowia bicuspidata var. bicuspidata NRRL YB-4993]